ncbi:MAG: transposase, partial [Candidatus Omnitrophica bacterium]|nr:transposase [Candidatus Omnitrophota bacterium]
MPRTKRLVPVNAALHIMCKANNKENLFNSEGDQLRYYTLLKDLKEENKIDIFHYCLMSNHLHLIVWINEQSNISRFMKQVNLSYFKYFSKIYGYSGHLWQNRFKSNIIDTDTYLLQCGKYIELNPVRAGIVSLPENYHFSSYNHYANRKNDTLITDSPMYIGLSKDDEGRRKEYVRFVVKEQLVNRNILAKQRFIG